MSESCVLVPLDGSAEAEGVVGVLETLRAPVLSLLHVKTDAPVEEAYFGRLEARLKAAGAREVRQLRLAGDPAQVILEAATSAGAGLIALSMHGRSGWDLLRLGSVAERVLRSATVPVLVVPKVAPVPGQRLLDRVLAAHDGSELSSEALIRLRQVLPESPREFHLIGVVEAMGGPAKLGGDDVVSRFYQLQADELRARLQDVAARTGGRVQVELGNPAEKILDHAKAIGATLIAMGSHGRSGLSRWTLGSVAEKVVRASPVPVLVSR